jgi:amino acid adenylation domain-containing protein
VDKPSTLSAVKQALLEQRWRKASQGLAKQPEIPKRPNRDFAPLSFIQRQMWVIDQITPGNPAYNLPHGYRLRGLLDVTALEDSFNEIIKRHEVLRTTFALRDAEPLQLIHPELKIKIKVTALDHLPCPERESVLRGLASEESLASFDLSRLPLIRVSLFKLGEAEHVLIINQHHIVADGLSMGLLLDELDTFYRAFTGGVSPRPPVLSVQYADFALWQQQTIAEGPAQARQLDFWRKRLSGVLPVLELPADRPRPPLQSFKGSNVFFSISAAQAEELKALGEREGCTFFMTVLAAFQVLLHRYSGAEDMVIGTPVSTRTHGDLEGLIGLFLNMVALRCDLSEDPTFLELLRRSREITLDAFSNGEVPLEILMNHLKVERDPRRNPVFQVVLQMMSNKTPKIGELDVSNYHFDLKFSQFDLTLHLYEEDGGYYGRFEYCSDLFDAPTIQRLCGHFLTLLEAIARGPNRSISQIIQQLAERIEREIPTSASNSLIPMKTQNTARLSHASARQPEIPKRPDRTSAPLSFAQRQMWVIDQMTPGNPAYNLSFGFRLRGRLNLGALEASFNEVIKRHEALRTTFAVNEGEPLQLTHPELKITIKVTALDHLSDVEREPALQALAGEESIESFDLSRLPLIRVALFKLAEAEHVLVMTLHHIVSDGLSTELLMKELNTFYQAFIRGDDPRPRELPVQYGDFALWQQQVIAKEAYATEVDFWRKQLGGKLPVLELAGDKPRPARQSFNGASIPFRIPTALVRDLRSIGAREKCSFFITILAAFHTLLQRYSGAEDIVIGTPVGIRSQAEVEPLIGNFLNMIALRCDLSGDPTFVELLRKSRDTTLDAFLNSELPFEAMMKHLKFERDPSRNPIFQVLLTVLPVSASQIGDLEISEFRSDVKVSQFDVSLHLYEEADGYVGEFVYCTDLFHAATMERLTANFLTMLQAVVRDPQRPISKLPILAAPERERLLYKWNATEAEFPAKLLMHELFEAQVERTPERTALIAGATTLTYDELNTRATRLAHALRARGAGRGQRIGLCVERGADMLAAVLGILKAGAAYVPLDPSYPKDRLRFMTEDAQLALLVSTTGLADDFALPRERQLLLDADADTIASMPGTRLPTDMATAHPEDPAYLIYTSGSTGKPKGVVIPHRAVVNFLTSMARKPGLNADDVLVAVTTLSFDIAVFDLQLPLAVGARVVIATHDEAVDGQALGALLDQHGATVLQSTPATWRLLLEAGWNPKAAFKAVVGGETLPKILADQMLSCGIELWNGYGPTETTVYSTCAHITNTTNGITIGRPIANTIVRVLDPQKNLCPIGVPGELYIGGAGVALGYWNRPALTADRFIPDPFGPSGAVLYRTGDLARWRNDGNLEHLGRLDFQVKLRGFRIEVGEIEAGIAQHPAVREVVVVAREDTPGDKRLVAYLIAENPPDDLADQLRARVRTTMPEYMVPAQFVLLPAMPRTQNGKVDRKALPASNAEDGARSRHSVAPRTATEELVAGVFGTVLNRANVGAFDNFFDLGGNSLMAARLMLQLRTASGHDLPLRVLFERQTVSALAEAVDGLAWLADSKRQPSGIGNRVEIQL